MSSGARGRVAAVVPDLMDRSRFGGRAVFVPSPDAPLPEGCTLLVIDLDRAGDLAGRLPADVHTIGFASHVHDEVLQAAVAAGVHEVLPRSRLFRRLAELLDAADG